MRRLLTAIAILVLGARVAAAGDYAERVILGFSADGSYFAFEEYGVQDGSGFPYVNIYVIDTATDSWVAGTPIRVRVDDERATVDDAREKAYQQAEPILSGLGIGLPGRLLVSNPITEITDGRNVDFLLRAFVPLQTEHWTLTLEEYAASTNCPDFGRSIVGFSLVLTAPDGTARDLNRDTRVPDSRNCPIGYAISDVLAYDWAMHSVLVVVLSVFSVGFEGPDRRFLAITTAIGE